MGDLTRFAKVIGTFYTGISHWLMVGEQRRAHWK
jgi:hypothetical protein